MVLVGKQKGLEIPLPGAMFVIGRDPLCHLRPHSDSVSRRHCAIACWNDRVLIRDLKSANGTFLNRKRIQNQFEVCNGDVLNVGDLSFAFQITDVVHVFNEDSVQWLMVDGDNSEVLNEGVATQMIDTSFLDGVLEAPSATSKGKGSGNLSAGKYLKDYLDS
ncbi:MAG: FHA domain-containing protein [Gemmataceae bacterium]|nr:FHA domain-containing protein [Gemmataceae bacterium]